MGFFSRLFGALRGGPAPAADGAGRNAFWVYVRCKACGEPIRVRVNREHDLSAEFEEGSDAPTGYLVHKDVVGERCFRRIQVDITLDGQRKVTDRQIQGGDFLTAEEYDAAVAAFAANPDAAGSAAGTLPPAKPPAAPPAS
jgi:hypothetical protein